MTRGRLGMIVCPMLEDEAIHNIETDAEEKKVYLVNTPYIETILKKLRQHKVDFTRISEKDALSGKFDDGYSVIIWTMFMGLHEDIDMLRMEIMNQIATVSNSVDSIFLYYGRCGRGLDGITDWARTMVGVPVMIFRNRDGTVCDDCICVPVGGTGNYLRLLRTHPGRLYFTPAMAGNFEGFLAAMELFNGIDTTNTEIMQFLLDMAGYTEILEINTGLGDQENFRENVDVFAKKYNLSTSPLEGWGSTDLADINYAFAKKAMTRWLDDGVFDKDFEVIE